MSSVRKVKTSRQFDSSLLQKLFRAKKTQLRMMQDRGFDIGAESRVLDMSLYDFQEYYRQLSAGTGRTFRSSMGASYQRELRGGEELDPDKYAIRARLTVVFADTEQDKTQIGKPIISEIVGSLKGQGVDHIMIITELPLSPEAKNSIASLPSLFIEQFTYEDIGYVPVDNFLVSKHTLLLPQQRESFLRGWPEVLDLSTPLKIKPSQLPEINIADIIARYYGARLGDIFLVERPDLLGSSVQDVTVSYRCVTNRKLPVAKASSTKTSMDVMDV